VGRFNWEAAREATVLNRPTRIALNFLDYIDFENRDAKSSGSLTKNAKQFVGKLEELCDARIVIDLLEPAFEPPLVGRCQEMFSLQSLSDPPEEFLPTWKPGTAATTGAGRVKTRRKSPNESVTPIANMMMVRLRSGMACSWFNHYRQPVAAGCQRDLSPFAPRNKYCDQSLSARTQEKSQQLTSSVDPAKKA